MPSDQGGQGRQDARNACTTNYHKVYCARVDTWTLGRLIMTMLTGQCIPKVGFILFTDSASV